MVRGGRTQATMEGSKNPDGPLQGEDPLSGLRLLVVDDNAANRLLVRAVLSPLGVIVTEAEDGAEGVAAARSSSFDAVLMDMQMPGLDGPAAAAMIRQGPGPNQNAPILAFSADEEFPGSALPDSPFDGFVSKPVAAADLVAAMGDCRSGRTD